MSKKWLTRLARIASGTFGSAKEDGFSLETSLTKFERFVHFWVLVSRSFVRNRCPVRASALSYTTLIAMIPMLAVAMSITSALLKSEGEDRIKQFIEQFVDKLAPTGNVGTSSAAAAKPSKPTGPAAFPGETKATNQIVPPPATATNFSTQLDQIQFDTNTLRAAMAASNSGTDSNGSPTLVTAGLTLQTNALASVAATNAPARIPALEADDVAKVKQSVSSEAANLIYEFAKKSYSGTLGVTGMIFLVLTAILTLTRVEETFNDIWGVTRGRDWWSRITNYFFTIALGPVLLIAALGLANSPNFQKTREVITIVPFIEPLLSTFLPVLMICFTFAMFYKLVPNTRVNFSAALVGGSLAGIAWHFYNQLGFLLASRAVSASAVYGSLAMIPLLMGGLYMAWLTVLFGAQVAYAFQNRASYLQDRLAENVNQRGREFVALRLMTCIGQRFNRGLTPPTIREISTELGIPSKLVQQVLRTLLMAGLVVEVAGSETAYAPARPLESINSYDVLLAMRATHGQEPATRDEPVRVEVLGEFARIQAVEKEAASMVTMLALVNRAQARLELAAPPTRDRELEAFHAAKNITPWRVAPDAALDKTPDVEFAADFAAAPTPPAAAAPAVPPPPAPKSISSPTPAVATHEHESFPL